MKNLTKFQKFLVVLLCICLPIGIIGMFVTMITDREPTVEEMQLYSPYDVRWDDLPAEDGQTRTEQLLALCQRGEDIQLEENTYASYTSETLGSYLYQCASVDQILVSADGLVLISYTDANGFAVALACDAEGTAEQSVYDPEKDLMFYANRETTIVYENFSNYSMS